MNLLLQVIKDYDIYIIIGLFIINIFIFIMLIINSLRISKLSRKYRKFMRGSKDKNIEELLIELMSKVDRAVENSNEIKSLYKNVNGRLNKCIQKVSLIRYKAFEDMGGAALSFSVAFLDDSNTGLMLTTIYGGDECSVYAKPIDKGIPKYDLSEEENHALEDAINKG